MSRNFEARRSRAFAFLIATVALTLALSWIAGCSDSKQIWSAESRSPDGLWIASAYTNQYGGLGNAGAETVVNLKSANKSQKTIQILGAANSGSDVNLKMNWLGPNHLEFVYTGDAEIYFQVAKCYGIDITARNLSEGPVTPSH
jgi:hypothetical protein